LETRLSEVPGVGAVLARTRSYKNESRGTAILRDFFRADTDHIVVLHDTARPALRHAARQMRWPATTGTTGCGRYALRWALANSTGYGSASAGRPERMDPAVFVLRPFSAAERAALPLTPGVHRR
jgi:PTH1 family peptidyl-tRNA hydrolase